MGFSCHEPVEKEELLFAFPLLFCSHKGGYIHVIRYASGNIPVSQAVVMKIVVARRLCGRLGRYEYGWQRYSTEHRLPNGSK